MKSLAVAGCLLLVGSSVAAQNSDYRNDFTSPPGTEWLHQGLAPVVPGSLTQGLVLNPNSRVILKDRPNPKLVHFHLYADAPKVRIQLSRSCDAGASPYVALLDSTIEAPVRTLIDIRVPAARDSTCNLMWSAPSDAPSQVRIAAVEVLQMQDADLASLRLQREIAEHTRIVMDQVSTTEAVERLQHTSRSAREGAWKYALISTEGLTTVWANQLGLAIAARGDMVNPLKYPAFKQLDTIAKHLLPAPAQRHLGSSRAPLGQVIDIVGQIASGRYLDALGSVSRLVPAIGAFTERFQGALAFGTDRGLIERYMRDDDPMKQDGLVDTLMLRSAPLLTRMREEADTFAVHMERSLTLTVESAALAAEADRQLSVLLGHAGLNTPEQVRAFRTAVARWHTEPTTPAIIAQFERQLSERIQVVIDSNNRTRIADTDRDLNRAVVALAQIQERATAIRDQQAAYYHQQTAYLCRMPPPPDQPQFPDRVRRIRERDRQNGAPQPAEDADLAKWRELTGAAATAMWNTEVAFWRIRQGHKPETHRECPNATQLQRETVSDT